MEKYKAMRTLQRIYTEPGGVAHTRTEGRLSAYWETMHGGFFCKDN